jgi:hypothetical protein
LVQGTGIGHGYRTAWLETNPESAGSFLLRKRCCSIAVAGASIRRRFGSDGVAALGGKPVVLVGASPQAATPHPGPWPRARPRRRGARARFVPSAGGRAPANRVDRKPWARALRSCGNDASASQARQGRLSSPHAPPPFPPPHRTPACRATARPSSDERLSSKPSPPPSRRGWPGRRSSGRPAWARPASPWPSRTDVARRVLESVSSICGTQRAPTTCWRRSPRVPPTWSALRTASSSASRSTTRTSSGSSTTARRCSRRSARWCHGSWPTVDAFSSC